MVNETEINDTEEKYLDYLDKASDEVVDFIFSKKTLDRVVEICENNGLIEEEKIENIAQRFVWVVLGNLPKENLSVTLEKFVGLVPETAKEVADEINRFISSAMVQLKSGKPVQPKEELPEEKTIEEQPKRPPSKDTYREPVE